MKAQVRYETPERATRTGERRDAWQRFSPVAAGLLGALLCAGLFVSSTGQALAGQPGKEMSSPGLWAVLSSQTQELVAQGQHFVSDVRVLYRVSQLEPLVTDTVAAPVAVPAAPAEADCTLISAPQHAIVLAKPTKARS